MSAKTVSFSSPKGFTLIELLVVITIIGILATGAIAMFTGSQAKARDAIRINDVKVTEQSAGMFNADYGLYPKANGASKQVDDTTQIGTKDNAVEVLKELNYLKAVPHDPSNKGGFHYVYMGGDNGSTGITNQYYEVDCQFETDANADTKGAKEDGNSTNDKDSRNKDLYELGNTTALYLNSAAGDNGCSASNNWLSCSAFSSTTAFAKITSGVSTSNAGITNPNGIAF
jgi:prepilin-type N-terminal cleavage/methylation domain-containing protein